MDSCSAVYTFLGGEVRCIKGKHHRGDHACDGYFNWENQKPWRHLGNVKVAVVTAYAIPEINGPIYINHPVRVVY